ncbi:MULTISPECIES: FtsB family cell division protein [Flexistipes]|uniref:Septum formation initiator n=2 Tax=Flexistipes sinusarabici TaxID=2352 RepID=F8E5R7_FLESM|nr:MULTISPECIES: septum formation initiator family protein [Flexistipes]AEI14698.1 Septum formation initiator [Flexistipes sinusarabici DSM 4947]MEC9492654.1 septum formation initiator family protein [Flexistipes sp.]HCW93421.1 septum formation initiator family protein [Flexistipes sinusarabici]
MKHNILYFGLVAALLLYLFFGNRGIIEYHNLLEIRNRYQQKVDNLTESIKSLERELMLIRQDEEYLEALIRRELNMKKPGEDLYILKDKNEDLHSNRDNKSN